VDAVADRLEKFRQHALSTIVTALSIALGRRTVDVGLVGLKSNRRPRSPESTKVVTRCSARADQNCNWCSIPFFHLESSPGNLAWTDYEDIAHNPNVELAVPIGRG